MSHVHFDDPKNVRLLISLGIISADTSVADVFLAWGRFIAQPEIRFHDQFDAVKNMTAAQKLEFRDRVAGVVPIQESRR